MATTSRQGILEVVTSQLGVVTWVRNHGVVAATTTTMERVQTLPDAIVVESWATWQRIAV